MAKAMAAGERCNNYSVVAGERSTETGMTGRIHPPLPQATSAEALGSDLCFAGCDGNGHWGIIYTVDRVNLGLELKRSRNNRN